MGKEDYIWKFKNAHIDKMVKCSKTFGYIEHILEHGCLGLLYTLLQV